MLLHAKRLRQSLLQVVVGLPREVLHGPGVHAGGRGFANKWKAALAQRMEGESPIAQPDFGEPETPDKTVLPDDYKAETGCTPPTDRGDVVYHHRLNYLRPGVAGESSDNAFCLGTPKRQKSGGLSTGWSGFWHPRHMGRSAKSE